MAQCVCLHSWSLSNTFSKIPTLQTFYRKYRPFRDPNVQKGLYYRPRSVNTDPLGNPVFVLLLDAKSAHDLVIREILVRRLFLDSTPDQRVRYWDLRLANRTTYCQWDGHTMGPIKDEQNLQQ